MQTKVIEFDRATAAKRELSLDSAELSQDKLYWIHCDLSEAQSFKKLASKLQLSSTLIKLCRDEDTSQRVIDTAEDLILQVPCLQENGQEANLLLYLKDNYCLTASYSAQPVLLDVLGNVQKNIKFALTPCFILFLILDAVINNYSTAIEKYEELSDSIDIQIREMHEGAYSEVMNLKKEVTVVKRYISSIRDILMRISGRKIALISEPCRLSLCNLFEHAQTVVNEAEAIRDILNSTLDLIDNSLMQKMNSTMKILAIFSSIFLPLSVITGIYGMNFANIPELHWQYGYLYALSLMFIVALSLLFFFKKKKWF